MEVGHRSARQMFFCGGTNEYLHSAWRDMQDIRVLLLGYVQVTRRKY